MSAIINNKGEWVGEGKSPFNVKQDKLEYPKKIVEEAIHTPLLWKCDHKKY